MVTTTVTVFPAAVVDMTTVAVNTIVVAADMMVVVGITEIVDLASS